MPTEHEQSALIEAEEAEEEAAAAAAAVVVAVVVVVAAAGDGGRVVAKVPAPRVSSEQTSAPCEWSGFA